MPIFALLALDFGTINTWERGFRIKTVFVSLNPFGGQCLLKFNKRFNSYKI
jgi:hypothetical protein